MVSLSKTLSKSRPIILLFGDSITQQGFGWEGGVGWASLLAADYTRRADVLNRGFSGYNTRHALELLVDDLSLGAAPPTTQILFCTVFFGANDAALPGERQHVPLEEYRENLLQIVTRLREQLGNKGKTGSTDESCTADDNNNNNNNPQKQLLPIVIITPPPVDADAWSRDRATPSSDRANEVARTYGLEAIQVAANLTNCSVLDTWTLLGGHESADQFGQNLRDGLHLSERGNRLVHQGLMQLLERDFPHLVPMLDGDGRYGATGIPLQEKLWTELC